MSIDKTDSLAEVKNSIYPEASKQAVAMVALWIDAFNRCEVQREMAAKMIKACNENAEAMRPRILKAITP